MLGVQTRERVVTIKRNEKKKNTAVLNISTSD